MDRCSQSVVMRFLFRTGIEGYGPEADLLRLRSDPSFPFPQGLPDFRDDPLFFHLPLFPARALARFAAEFKETDSLKSALGALPFNEPFEPGFLKSIVASSHQTQFAGLVQVLFLYQCLAWISLSPTAPRANSDVSVIFEMLNSLLTSTFPFAYNDIIRELIRIALDPDEMGIDSRNIRLILKQIAQNQTLGASFVPTLLALLDRIILIDNEELFGETLGVFLALFERKSPLMDSMDYAEFLRLLRPFFTNMNYDVLHVLAYSSQHTSNPIIAATFSSVPADLIDFFSQRDPVFVCSSDHAIADGYDEETPIEVIISSGPLSGYCNHEMLNVQTKLEAILAAATFSIVDDFVSALASSEKLLKNCKNASDFCALVCLMLPRLGEAVSIAPLLPMILSCDFFSSKLTILALNGLHSSVNAIRCHVFQTLVSLDPSLLYNVLEKLSLSPILTAECLVRLSFRFGALFFVDETVLSSLFTSINVLQHQHEGVNQSIKKKSLAVIFATLFSILRDPSIALRCFVRHSFSTSFLNLMFNKKYTQIVIESFTTCLAAFEELPQPIVMFLSLVFCADSSAADSDFTHIALTLMRGMVMALSHNPALGKSFSSVYENCIKFARRVHSRGALELSMTILTFITQSLTFLEISDAQFNQMLDVCEELEGQEPTDAYALACINLIGGATNLGFEQMFNIRITKTIAFFFCVLRRSQKLKFAIETFQKLCQFSMHNVTACHEGKLALLLLKGLAGAFAFRNRQIAFDFSEESVRAAAFKLISIIVSELSSVAMDQAFLDLLKLDDADGLSLQALTTLHGLFQNHEGVDFQIWSPQPIVEIADVSGSKIMLGFSFSFFVKLDTASLKKTDIRFVFLRLEDASGRFIEIFQEKENLVFRYESETLRTSAPVADRIQSNQWTLVTAMLNVTETQSVIVFRYGLEMSEDIIFRTVELDKKLTGAIGFTHGGTVESTGFSPVIMGRFALIFHPYTDWDFHCLHDNGFSELNRFRNVPLASSNCFQNAVAKREDQSIFGLMPRHVTFADFSTLFDRGRHRSPQFIEIALITLLECTDFQLCKTGKACMSLTDEDRSPFEFFTTITGIPERYLFEQGVPSLGFRFSMPLSEISTIISQLLRSNDFYIDSGLFPAFLEMIHATNDEGLILEILENVIFNLWIWGTSSQSHCQRMFRQLANFLSLFRFPNQHDLFVEFLLQSHWFENYSTHSFPGFHSLKLKDEHQIFDYLVLLARKSVVVPIDCLLALCDCVETCSFEIASQILAVVAGHTTGRRSTFELCLIRLALKWRDLSLVQLVNDELDVFCIHQLRAGARTAGGSPPLIKNFTSTTYFWVIFVSLRVDSREFEYVPLTLIDTGLDILSTQFSAVLNLLAIFKATGVFSNVFELALLFLERVLKVLVDNGTVVASKDKLRMFALRSFVALCYKLKKGSISSLLRKEFAKSPFSEEFAKGPRPTFETDFVVSSLPTIFSDSIRDLEFRPRVSDRDRSVFSFLIRFLELPEFEGDKLISQCRLFLQRQLPLLRQSELFAALQDFVSNLNSEVRRQLTEVQVLVNATPVPQSHQLMTDCLFCERLRLKHLHICAHPDESRFDQSPMSRFLRFPYPLPSRVAWTYLRESDEFIPAKLQYVPTKLALVYSTPCTLMTLAGQRQATFSILSSEIRISRIGAAVIAIPFDSISLLTYFHVNGVEIFTAGCQSHLLEFSNGEVPQVISILRGFDVPISRDQETTQKEVIGLWSHGKLSTFDLLLSLNILAGRSFHELFAYPIFPVIHQEDAAVLSEAAQTEQYAAAVSRWLLKMNLLCSGPTFPTAYDDLLRQNELDGMIPEVYFSFPAFNATDHSRIYESRRLFDSCHIKDWVERKFHVQLPPKVPIIVRRPAASWTVVHRKVSSGSFFEGGIDYFFTFSEEGCRLNVFYLVVGGTPPLVKLRSFRRSLSLSRDVHFCALMSVLLVVDVGKCRTYRIFDRPENDTLWQSLAVTHMRSLGNSIVFVIDSSIVAICRATLFPHRRRTIASETSRITLLQTSAAYSVVVYATEFAKVLILSGFDGVVLGKIEFSGEIVRNLLVTECWGFVLVNTNNAIYVLSLNGLLLARVEWAKVVVDWTSYQTANADMVVVLDARMKLSMFDAFRPQKIEKLTKLSEAIVAMSADGVKGVLALLTAGGRLMLLPLPEHG